MKKKLNQPVITSWIINSFNIIKHKFYFRNIDVVMVVDGPIQIQNVSTISYCN